MTKKANNATSANSTVAEVAAELSASPEKLEAFIASYHELVAKAETLEAELANAINTITHQVESIAKTNALEAELEAAKATIAELMATNENLEAAAGKASKSSVKVKGQMYELAIPSSYLKVNGEMVLVNAEYLNNNPKLAEKLLSEGHSIFKQEGA